LGNGPGRIPLSFGHSTSEVQRPVTLTANNSPTLTVMLHTLVSLFDSRPTDFTRRGVGPALSSLVSSRSLEALGGAQSVPMVMLKPGSRPRESFKPEEWTDELVAQALDRPAGWVLKQGGDDAPLFCGLYDMLDVSFK
jgi:hypothetical protein